MSVVYIVPEDSDGNEKYVAEDSSCILEFELKDPKTGNPVPDSAINSATAILYDDISEDEIVNIGDVSSYFDANGDFSYNLAGQYNGIVDTESDMSTEVHWLKITLEFDAGNFTHNLIVNLKVTVENNKYVT